MTNSIGIIGGGFSGMMTATQLIRQAQQPFHLLVFEKNSSQLSRGIAYSPYSDKHILNVVASKMSAFPEEPNHFLDWVMAQEVFKTKDKTLIANSFLSRKLYGDYLDSIWHTAMQEAVSKNIQLSIVELAVVSMDCNQDEVWLTLENGEKMVVDKCVLASGNLLPRNPTIVNTNFYKSDFYFQNPWQKDTVENLNDAYPILIIGNGLTMVDTILGCLEQGYKGKFISISPNGFNMLMHRHNCMQYQMLHEELPEKPNLNELVSLVNHHIKTVREFGVSAEPVIDSLRPHTQRLWQQMTEAERKKFFYRLRHLWGVARHRIPVHSFDKIQQLRIDGRLKVYSGKLIDLKELNGLVHLSFYDKKGKQFHEISVSRVINCTGPETNLSLAANHFLNRALLSGIVHQDPLKLGIRTDVSTFRILKKDGTFHRNLFTLGGFLKGELWESTAVNELRTQAKNLAKNLCELINND